MMMSWQNNNGGILSPVQLIQLLLMSSAILSLGSCQHCRLINETEVSTILSQVHPPSDWVVLPLTVVDYNITCLAVSSLRDRYRYVSVFVTYLNNNVAINAMLDIGCSATTNQWDPGVLGEDNTFVPTNSLVAGDTRWDCASCMNTAASDNLTHCVACHSDCSDDNSFGGCVDDCGRQCCNVYIDGVCSESCGEGETISSNFTCINITNVPGTTIQSSTSSCGLLASCGCTSSEVWLCHLVVPSICSCSMYTASTLIMSTTTTTNTPTPTTTATTVDSLYNQMLRMTLLSSILTSLVTLIISVLLTLLIVACVCNRGISRKHPLPLTSAVSNPRVSARHERTPSTSSDPEYIIPLTSPSTNTERSLGITDSLSLQYNLSYFKSPGERVDPATADYEYPDTMAPLMPRHSPMSRSCPEVPLLGGDKQHHKVIVD